MGFLGPGDLEPHINHARGFAAAYATLRRPEPSTVLDLGAGGGIPGLVLFDAWPEAQFLLLDGSEKRCKFLSWAADELGAGDRTTVLCGRAEDLAHRTDLRESVSLVVARSFGAPAVLAECAAGFLAENGALVVSEPPDEDLTSRWPSNGLAKLGFSPANGVFEGSHYAVVVRTQPCPSQYPRRVGVPTKRPLF